MNFYKKELMALIIPFIIIAIIYLFLPAKIPRQFHFNGQPTSYMAKEFIFIIGFIPYIIYLRYRPK
jgi:uncharacterized membrane protein